MKMKLFVPCPCSHAHTPQKKVFYQKTESPSNSPFQATPPREHETSLIIQTKEKRNSQNMRQPFLYPGYAKEHPTRNTSHSSRRTHHGFPSRMRRDCVGELLMSDWRRGTRGRRSVAEK